MPGVAKKGLKKWPKSGVFDDLGRFGCFWRKMVKNGQNWPNLCQKVEFLTFFEKVQKKILILP